MFHSDRERKDELIDPNFSELAIHHLNGQYLPGQTQPLQVRFADSDQQKNLKRSGWLTFDRTTIKPRPPLQPSKSESAVVHPLQLQLQPQTTLFPLQNKLAQPGHLTPLDQPVTSHISEEGDCTPSPKQALSTQARVSVPCSVVSQKRKPLALRRARSAYGALMGLGARRRSAALSPILERTRESSPTERRSFDCSDLAGSRWRQENLKSCN